MPIVPDLKLGSQGTGHPLPLPATLPLRRSVEVSAVMRARIPEAGQTRQSAPHQHFRSLSGWALPAHSDRFARLCLPHRRYHELADLFVKLSSPANWLEKQMGSLWYFDLQ